MALNKQNLIALAKTVAKADPTAPVAYSFNEEKFDYATLNETLRKEFNEYAGSYSDYRENKNLIFSIIEEVVDDVLPKRIEESYSLFAEVRSYKQGDKPLFRRKTNARTRAKQFITRVGLAGQYEVFKLAGGESFEVPTSAIGGAAQIGFEEFLDGKVDFSEVIDIVMEGMDELIYREATKALQGAINQLPSANTASVAGFDEQAFDSLLNVASAYGEPTIYCTQEFASKLVPAEAWRYTEAMKTELWNNGRLTRYKNHTVVILPQGFTDETNSKKLIDPGYCWIIPSGADKPVKIALEGNTIVDEYVNDDRSREIQVYKKVGVVALMSNNICSYIDTSLKGNLTTWDFSNKVENVVKVSNADEFNA